ncbi:hypothetical protein RRG08_016796 [Elysia crispata]|uniref:Uncharacterized protein n=1 Tax=Elysia crispata TaxID=231223 RepID=A0AAE1A169_9GAST|nr:hypothetical protein RRG08_016796 [Elysia crispata]
MQLSWANHSRYFLTHLLWKDFFEPSYSRGEEEDSHSNVLSARVRSDVTVYNRMVRNTLTPDSLNENVIRWQHSEHHEPTTTPGRDVDSEHHEPTTTPGRDVDSEHHEPTTTPGRDVDSETGHVIHAWQTRQLPHRSRDALRRVGGVYCRQHVLTATAAAVLYRPPRHCLRCEWRHPRRTPIGRRRFQDSPTPERFSDQEIRCVGLVSL